MYDNPQTNFPPMEVKAQLDLPRLDRGEGSQDDDISTIPSPSPIERLSRTDLLKQGIKDALKQKPNNKQGIEVEYFEGFKAYERWQSRVEKNNEFEKAGRTGIMSISKRKLIEKLTHDYQQDSVISRVVLYTYKWYFDEKELFTLLLERFKTPVPLNLSPVERKSFLDSVISKIQIKILIFLKDWFKLYSFQFYTDSKLEEMFFELLYLMFTHPDTGKWIHLPINQLLSDLENLNQRREENVKSVLKIASLPEIFVPLPMILSYSHLLAKQLCMVDIENFKKIKVNEFYKKAWNKNSRYVDSPNLTHIAETSTKLSRLTSYLILMNKKSTIRVILFQYLIDLCEQLVRLRNYNSAFAIYLGLSGHAVQRLYPTLIEPTLEKEAKEIYQTKLKQLFSSSNNMEMLRAKQNETMIPAVPYLGVYLSEILFMEEMKDYIDEEKKMLNLTKFSLLSEKIFRVLQFKESYGFHKVDNIMNFLKGIPMISEDQIYQLSYSILPT